MGKKLNPVLEQFTPLAERAVRRDGTIGLRIIAPGWGSTGYYDKAVLERDIPRVFPAGTQMFWNHPTPSEESERPEGDLDNRAAVFVSDPYWQESGPAGPGMYVDAKVFGRYRETIDEIGEHIGVSIRGGGVVAMGEAEGRRGKIVKEIKQGKSVDFVTVPGAGGQIVSIFEAAGRNDAETDINEAANVGEYLESRLHLALTEMADNMFGEGRLTRDERKALSGAIGRALDAYHKAIAATAPQLYERGPWQDAPVAAPVAGIGESDTTTEDRFMSEEMLKETQGQIQAQSAQIAQLRESLLLRDARDFVTQRLAATDLPEITRGRLAASLIQSLPITEGKLDETALDKRVETAVSEARAEIAAVIGQNGRVYGQGSSPAATKSVDETAVLNEAAALLQRMNGVDSGLAQSVARARI